MNWTREYLSPSVADQQVAAREQAGEGEPQGLVLADDDPAELGEDLGEPGGGGRAGLRSGAEGHGVVAVGQGRGGVGNVGKQEPDHRL